jgi:pimeloyl-ACP methyl ester carboxylesterase
MPAVQLPSSITHYEDTGRGPPMVMIHGMGGDHTVWDPSVARLSARFRLIRPDILGHGRSRESPPPGPWQFSQFARQVEELLVHLDIDSAVIMGFSLGGMISQAVAIEHPARTKALVIVSSVCNRTVEEQAAIERRVKQVAAGGPAAVVEGALQRWFSPAFAERHPDVIDDWRRRTLANDPRNYALVYRLYADTDRQLLDRLGVIAAPTLILTGDRDQGQTPRMAQEMARRIKGSEVVILPGVPHMLPIEAADALSSSIIDFLDRRRI